MVDYATANYPEILAAVAEDHTVDTEEANALRRRLFGEDGSRVIDQDEAEFLFELNDYVSDNIENCQTYEDLFIEAIIGYLLHDNFSPADLDDLEWRWLKDMMSEDNDLDLLEIRLLDELSERVTAVPGDFEEYIESFEEIDYGNEVGSTFFAARIARNIGGKVRKAKDMLGMESNED